MSVKVSFVAMPILHIGTAAAAAVCCITLIFLPYFFIQNLVDLLVVTHGTDLVSLEVEKNLKF